MESFRDYLCNQVITFDWVDLRIKDAGGLEQAIEKQFVEVDCSKVLSNGMRNIQTIDFRYGYELRMALNLIDMIDNINLRAGYIETLEHIHRKNLEFEKINPPIPYTKKTTKGNGKKRVKQERFDFDKDVTRDYKVKHRGKIYEKLKFDFKPV